MMFIIVLLLVFNDVVATVDSVAANDDVDDSDGDVVDDGNDDNNSDIINDASFSFDHNTILIFRWKLKETIKLMET